MRLCLIAVLLLAGCSPVRNTFDVDAAGYPDAVAVLVLCGKELPLTRLGSKLEVTSPITCEGEGDIQLRFKERGQSNCHVGYVTPGAVQVFRFRLRDGRCDPMS